jgi:hypothetical protein
LPKDSRCIADAEGKVVKVISRLLLSLPENHEYRVLFMRRPLTEVLVSQDEMLRRRGTYKEGTEPAVIAAAFEKHVREVYAWLDGKPYVRMLPVEYHNLLTRPRVIVRQIADFLGTILHVDAMERQVDPSLYRNRRETSTLTEVTLSCGPRSPQV